MDRGLLKLLDEGIRPSSFFLEAASKELTNDATDGEDFLPLLFAVVVAPLLLLFPLLVMLFPLLSKGVVDDDEKDEEDSFDARTGSVPLFLLLLPTEVLFIGTGLLLPESTDGEDANPDEFVSPAMRSFTRLCCKRLSTILGS